jgi:hypothetical protein
LSIMKSVSERRRTIKGTMTLKLTITITTITTLVTLVIGDGD